MCPEELPRTVYKSLFFSETFGIRKIFFLLVFTVISKVQKRNTYHFFFILRLRFSQASAILWLFKNDYNRKTEITVSSADVRLRRVKLPVENLQFICNTARTARYKRQCFCEILQHARTWFLASRMNFNRDSIIILPTLFRQKDFFRAQKKIQNI